jgi:hypothetical protein
MSKRKLKHCVCNAPEGAYRAVRLAKERRWDDLARRLCPTCANEKIHGLPAIFRVAMEAVTDVRCWEIWRDAGADMCVRHEGRTVLEDCVSIWGTMGMYGGCTKYPFDSLLRFFLFHHYPELVFISRFPKRLPDDHRDILNLHITLFRNAVQHEIDTWLSPISGIVMDYFWYDRIVFA